MPMRFQSLDLNMGDNYVDKHRLISSIDSIVQSSPDDGLIYANVELQVNGWAKSHRPVNKIFNDKNIESITAGN